VGQELLTHKEQINSYLVFHGVNVVCISIIILGVLSHIGIIGRYDITNNQLEQGTEI
jgi:hypothetical protein